MSDLFVEYNSTLLKEAINANGMGLIYITPEISEDYWILRCRITKKQALLIFPKFGTFGCGFAKEIDWNTNLPIAAQEEAIWNHIKINRAGCSIEKCKESLHLLRKVAKELGLIDEESEKILQKGD